VKFSFAAAALVKELKNLIWMSTTLFSFPSTPAINKLNDEIVRKFSTSLNEDYMRHMMIDEAKKYKSALKNELA